MRDWLLVLVPLVIVVYFAVFPDQFHALVSWLSG
jgi:hypothetical protein